MRKGCGIFAVGLICLLLIGSIGATFMLKLDYDAKLDALVHSIEDLQKQLASAESGRNYSGVSYVPTLANNLSVSDVAEKAGASVVGITITTQVLSGRYGMQIMEQTSQGSGIICSDEGYIITNYHVVKPYLAGSNSQMEVFLADGRSAGAEYIGGDEQNDLAVIQIQLDNLPVAEFGSSSSLRAGEFAMAIGNPLGMEGTITVGVISGIDRKVQAENVAESLIQTDAAINPGNSGGALVNSLGQVIGINTIKISATEVEGIGFAIPIDYALPIIQSIIEYGYVRGRPATGITGIEIDALTARFNNVPQGLLVTGVVKDSAADIAGIREQDIVLEMGGRTIGTMGDINSLLKQYRVGDQIEIKIYRRGSIYTAVLTLLEGR